MSKGVTMAKLLCVSDLHDVEKKHKQMVEYAKGCDILVTCGDDFDREEADHQYEANLVIGALFKKHQQQSGINPATTSELESLLRRIDGLPEDEQESELGDFSQKHPEFEEESNRVGTDIKNGFLTHFKNRAKAINSWYTKAGIPVFGTPGNHDPLPALEELKAVKYLAGTTENLGGLNFAGLPATGEWVSGPMRFCPEFYPHLTHYSPVKDEKDAGEISGSAKKLLEHQGTIDVFVTHKAYKPDLQKWDKYYAQGDQFGVDAGAVAVAKKHKPKLNVFGHYHMAKPRVAFRDGTFHLYVGPNAAVKVTLDGNKPVDFESIYYS